MNMNIIAFVVVGVLSLVALVVPQLPDIYYVGFQVVVFVVFGITCFKCLGYPCPKMKAMGIGSAVIALSFNPIIYIFTDGFLGIGREAWLVADALLIAICVFAVVKLSRSS